MPRFKVGDVVEWTHNEVKWRDTLPSILCKRQDVCLVTGIRQGVDRYKDPIYIIKIIVSDGNPEEVGNDTLALDHQLRLINA